MKSSIRIFIFVFVILFPVLLGAAEDRIVDRVDVGRTALIPGPRHPQAVPQNDRGLADPAAELSYVTLVLRPAPGLVAFLAAQQDPASPDYRRWLTPEQFGDRFGVSANDVSQLVQWLRSEGLRVHDVARGRHWITFSGPVERVGHALHTEFHRYAAAGGTHIANASDASVPAAFAGVIAGFDRLDDFGDRALYVPAVTQPDAPQYNGGGGRHYLTPADFATIYRVKPLYDAGIDGRGVKIAVIGQTSLDMSDIEKFRSQFGLPVNAPEVRLIGPDPGIRSGDVVEAALDLEWSGAVAPNAGIVYVNSASVRTSAQYAVDQNLAPIMTYSYGACERSSNIALHYVGMQANAQGITWMVASGDAGATTCDVTAEVPQSSKGPSLSYPANIPEVTAVGGTRFNEGSGQFWAASNDPATGASALSYVPEIAWNDTSRMNAFAASGGGASAIFPKPWWQIGPGVPDDHARDVPDLALSASPDHVAYLIVSGGKLGAVGGTSAGSPAFAGIVALLNQYLVSKNSISQPGVGNINPVLYRLAQSTKDVFHDITDGDNRIPCAQSSPACVDGLTGASAGPGYDLATGLGTVDAYNLVTEWTTGTSTATTVTADPVQADLNGSVSLTAVVSGGNGTAPTGIVTFLVNDAAIGSAPLTAQRDAASAGITVSAMLAAAGSGLVTAMYGGDAVYAGSSGSVAVSLKLPSSGSLVTPLISPNPVPQSALNSWPYTITLTEKAGVATTLTGFTINGVDNSANIAAFNKGNIAANGSYSASFAGTGLTPPVDRTYIFTGRDADGTGWTRQLTVTFAGPLGPMLGPSIAVTRTPAAIQRNPQADPACQFSQQVTIEEGGGYLIHLTKLTVDAADWTTRIPQLFGTTRMAPFGSLNATFCFDGNTTVPSTKTVAINASAESGSATLTYTFSTSFQAEAVAPVSFSVVPTNVVLTTPDCRHDAAATLGLTFGGAVQWRASVLPANATTTWLTLTPLSGSGSGQLTLAASSAGLSNGAYLATIAVEAPGAIPAYQTVPVVFVVGESGGGITSVVNAASYQPAVAPGMLAAVYGAGLSSTTSQAGSIPVPFNLSGVSVTVNGISAPVLGTFPESGQINIQIPYEAGAGPAVLAVENQGRVYHTTVSIAPTAPGLFGIWDAAGRPVTSMQQGQSVVAYITGEGDVTPTLASGATPASGTSISRLPAPRLPVSITVGGVDVGAPQFVGITNGVVGATQINFAVPKNAPSGLQNVVVTVGGVPSQPLPVGVTPAQ
ncbi:MAG TPA: protease pro-enzyme activation domain-containing protein [Bryobacteraceae bacterium]